MSKTGLKRCAIVLGWPGIAIFFTGMASFIAISSGSWGTWRSWPSWKLGVAFPRSTNFYPSVQTSDVLDFEYFDHVFDCHRLEEFGPISESESGRHYLDQCLASFAKPNRIPATGGQEAETGWHAHRHRALFFRNLDPHFQIPTSRAGRFLN